MAHRNYCMVSGVLFFLVALAHLLRVVYGVQVQIEEVAVPMYVSWVGFVVPAALSYWALKTARTLDAG